MADLMIGPMEGERQTGRLMTFVGAVIALVVVAVIAIVLWRLALLDNAYFAAFWGVLLVVAAFGIRSRLAPGRARQILTLTGRGLVILAVVLVVALAALIMATHRGE